MASSRLACILTLALVAILPACGQARTTRPPSEPRGPETAVQLMGVSPRPGRTTAIEFCLVEGQDVSLTLRDGAGRLVSTLADGPLAGGRHERLLDGPGLAGGTYLATLATPGGCKTMKILLVN